MPEPIAGALVWALSLYALVGLVFALPFAIRGAGRIDPAARTGTIGFRILVIPGAVALWPLLMSGWLRGRTAPPNQRTAHQPAAKRTP
jgi:hypothetical protein